jgi:hypothetical protein
LTISSDIRILRKVFSVSCPRCLKFVACSQKSGGFSVPERGKKTIHDSVVGLGVHLRAYWLTTDGSMSCLVFCPV